jgi:hypothetical protein
MIETTVKRLSLSIYFEKLKIKAKAEFEVLRKLYHAEAAVLDFF